MKNSIILVVGLITLSSCASGAKNLKPTSVGRDEAAIFGRIQVTNLGKDITTKCYAEFTDAKGDRKTYTSLDETGWVFTTVKPGDTFLSFIQCNSGGFSARMMKFWSRDLKFTAPGNGKIAYFGHVSLTMDYENGVKAYTILAGTIGNSIAAAVSEGSETRSARLENRMDEAVTELRKTYGADSSRLVPLAVAPRWAGYVRPENRAPASN